MKSQKRITVMVLALFLVPLLAACGPTKIDAALTTYKITLSKNVARAGEMVFHVHNDAIDLKHEFVIFKTDLPADQLPMTPEGIMDEEGQGVTHIDEVDVEPGQAADLDVTLESGRYVIVCNIDSTELHYKHGMYTVFTVQ
jgi:uncharacterized cupredoxin-like copper-binding protein